MLPSMQVLTLAVMVVAVSAAFAHALELPGKMRLTKDEVPRRAVDLLSGIHDRGRETEPLATILLLDPHRPDAARRLVAAGRAARWGRHANRLFARHPPAESCLAQAEGAVGGRVPFFSIGHGCAQRGGSRRLDALRDRWEHSHVVRADSRRRELHRGRGRDEPDNASFCYSAGLVSSPSGATSNAFATSANHDVVAEDRSDLHGRRHTEVRNDGLVRGVRDVVIAAQEMVTEVE